MHRPDAAPARLDTTAHATTSTPPSLPSSPSDIPSPRPIIEDALESALDPSSTSNAHLDPDFVRRLTRHVTEQVLRSLNAPDRAGSSSASSSSNVYSSQPPPPPPRPSYCSPTYPAAIDPSVVPLSLFTSDFVDFPPPVPFPIDSMPSPPSSPVCKRTDLHERPMEQTTDRGERAACPKAEDVRANAGTAVPVEATTTLEKIWQPLFDPTGRPTPRLSQFLRGLARHLIDHYEPHGSLVITPHKMLRLLRETKPSSNTEPYPWATIFGGAMSADSISTMYKKLLCQHHFVQQYRHEPPTIPALTPAGFDVFMTCLIQAHPDAAFERLSKAVKEMPISNADDHRERFPKELSRRMLPGQSNKQAEQRLISSLNHEPQLVPLERGASAIPPPPPQKKQERVSPYGIEREGRSYDPLPSRGPDTLEDDDDLLPPGIPLERERKPYRAKEGSGKQYDSDPPERHGSIDARSELRGRRGTSTSGGNRPGYQEQTLKPQSRLPPQATYDRPPVGGTPPINIPPSNRRYRTTAGAPPPPPPPPIGGEYARNRRQSSPPVQRSYTRSEPGDLGFVPSMQYASNLDDSPKDRNYDEESFGRFGSARTSPAAPSSGTWNTGKPSPSSGDRRRSAYGPGGPGTSGYGSYTSNGSTYGSSTQH